MKAAAIFGGSFNPIHLGHLAVAEEIRTRFNLDKVFFVPAFQPPHKDAEELVDARSRLLMAHLATVSNPCFEVSPFEIDRGGRSYTIDTLRHFRTVLGESTQLYFILGADMLMELGTWRNIEEALRITNFIVVTRPGYDASKIMNHQFLGAAGQGLSPDALDSIRVEACPHLDISSTGIRARVREWKSIKYLVPEAVEQFIHNQRLYL
jgi:nicotinate-nucleotide adenylyltransferase